MPLTNHIVPRNTVLNNNTIANNALVCQYTILFKINKKLVTIWSTTVSWESNWLYHADFSLK